MGMIIPILIIPLDKVYRNLDTVGGIEIGIQMGFERFVFKSADDIVRRSLKFHICGALEN